MASTSTNLNPPYPDVLAEERLTDSSKKTLLTSKWDAVHQFVFPSRYVGGKFRKIQSHWFISNTWLCYSQSREGVYCAPCYLFGGKDIASKQKSLSAVAVIGPSNIGKLIHEPSSMHSASCEAAQSNFTALLQLQAKHNTVLQDHLTNCSTQNKYTSPDIQNELISICGGLISKAIVDACNSAPFFGFIADEATDAATMEQMAVVLRYFDRRRGKVCEDFLVFATCEATTGEALANAFLANLRAAGVNVPAMRGQGYDGAANMSGCHRGVQARIQQVVPRALNTHCKAHSLNLAIGHASKEPYARNMMTTVQEIAFLFDYSAKRLLRFQEFLSNSDEDRAEMERRTKLKTLCETRWAARSDALFTFKAAFGTVVRTLENLGLGNDAKAGAYRAAITQFSFIITLVAVEHVLSVCVQLSKQLQATTCDLLQAAVEADVVKAQVQAERNDPRVWQVLFEKASEMARSVEVEPALPRAGRQQNRPNAPAANASDYWWVNMYLPFVDHLLTELQHRLLQGNERYVIQYLLPNHIRDLIDQRAEEIFGAAQEDLTVDRETFVRDRQRWKTRCEHTQIQPSPSLESVLLDLPEDLYPNVARCLHLLLAMPVSTASAERSFSSMRRLKTYLRSTMSTERMSGLGLLHVHRDRELNAATVVDLFAQRKNRRLALLFNDN